MKHLVSITKESKQVSVIKSMEENFNKSLAQEKNYLVNTFIN